VNDAVSLVHRYFDTLIFAALLALTSAINLFSGNPQSDKNGVKITVHKRNSVVHDNVPLSAGGMKGNHAYSNKKTAFTVKGKAKKKAKFSAIKGVFSNKNQFNTVFGKH